MLISKAATVFTSSFMVRGLDLQLFQELNKIATNSLVPITDLNIKHGAGLFPYLQPPAKAALKRALDILGEPITINSGYRSVASQSLLYYQKQVGLIKNLVAYPGVSPHQRATCVDVEEWERHAVKQALLESGWNWTYGLRDAMHFDCNSRGLVDIRKKSVIAFQRLWNKANPKSRIAEDGDLGQQTLNAIYKSPCEGFANVFYPRILRCTQPVQEGEDVGEIQLALRKHGYTLPADCIFGQTTENVVKLFQLTRLLTSDGVVGAATRKAILGK